MEILLGNNPSQNVFVQAGCGTDNLSGSVSYRSLSFPSLSRDLLRTWCRKILTLAFYSFSKKINYYFKSSLFAHCGAQTYNHEIKSQMLCRVSHPGTQSLAFYMMDHLICKQILLCNIQTGSLSKNFMNATLTF